MLAIIVPHCGLATIEDRSSCLCMVDLHSVTHCHIPPRRLGTLGKFIISMETPVSIAWPCLYVRLA